MKPISIMFIAGEASGDALASELVTALSARFETKLEMFGAGGPKMAAVGVKVAIDMTQHSVIGLIEVVKKYPWFKKAFAQLKQLAIERKPDIIICVDFGGFNRRFAHAIRELTRRSGKASEWNPKIVQYVSPQVWASRPGRAKQMAQDLDLLLSLFPFENDWYARHAPQLRVEFVGHPIADRFSTYQPPVVTKPHGHAATTYRSLDILLLPGSRAGELRRHLPVMLKAARQIAAQEKNARFEIVLPTENLTDLARKLGTDTLVNLTMRPGDITESLSHAAVAIASTGTVTLECAYFGVPTIAIYKTSWSTYQIGKRIIKVRYLAMPNLLANKTVFPEFIQGEATAEKISTEALDLLNNPARRKAIKEQLKTVMASLGGPGASERAASAIFDLFAAE
ncbi:MAG: Lipid-A-disaccharide synthase [Verrucomicrobiales bacterium]|nr:Lipid-A-disaccharide synthase [Verrucomicrobiales bacterium]